ncbi:alpha-2-macroglobulin [Roseateles sp. DAIF2]|uniref:alpha-2-macroglobulin family protein n=1 Tax=Roseateles sp. DAIF2 TaxID=2714952 RepID=UPI0018A290E6|nr:Ig-like domain-containing alpha-2-macroglobulin family protein [Roseateles sp. DAIF2]QPF73030.1 alpha-2-macroglobulin [Roseateles sp. DAIF2]
MRSATTTRTTTRGLLAAFLLLLLNATAVQAASVVQVSPQGEVAQARQLRLRFSEAVVPQGDPRLPDPAALSCDGLPAPKGNGRWSGANEWLFDLNEPLPAGARCRIALRAEFKPLQGELSGPREFTFNTGAPSVVQVEPWPDSRIEEGQAFLLQLTGAIKPESLARGAWCEAEGIGERLPVRAIIGPEREALLKSKRIAARLQERYLLLSCQRPLPPKARVRLVWGPGLASALNPQLLTRAEQRFDYQVREPLTAEFSCERERAGAPCLPIRPLALRFSDPVPREAALAVRLKPASGAAIAPLIDKDDKSPELSEIRFPTPLAENAAFTLELPASIKDASGRPLANAASFPLKVTTGGAPPIAKFAAAPFGIVELPTEREAGSPALLPITLRHTQPDMAAGAVRIKRLETDAEVLAAYLKLKRWHETQLPARELGLPRSQWTETVEDTNAQGRTISRQVTRYVATREVPLLDARDPAAQQLTLPALQAEGKEARPFEVVGLPIAKPGYHLVEIASPRLGQALLDKAQAMYVRTGVLVTNLGVHFKWGRENSLVWVTSLDRGRPVAGAEVAVSDCRGKRLWAGRTDAQGRAAVPQALELPRGSSDERCEGEYGFFVTARSKSPLGVQDMAFVFSGWNRGIESWRFNHPTARGAAPDARAHTVLDRSLLRAGETVSMKHYFRFETGQGLTLPKPDQLPTRVRLTHEGSGQEFLLPEPLAWEGQRSALSQWAIPPAAKLGVYQVSLERGEGAAKRSWPSGDFRVEEFRVPLVEARLTPPKGPLVAPGELKIPAQLNYLSGGGMAQVSLSVSALLRPRGLNFAGYEDFQFQPPRDPQSQQADATEEGGEDAPQRNAKLVADKLALSTDRQGAATIVLKGLPKLSEPSELLAEVSFNDPNGERQTRALLLPLWSAKLALGLRAASWASNRGKVAFKAVALDLNGKPLAGQAVAVRARVTQTLSTRKRMVGGFYAYDNRVEVKELGAVCEGKSDAQGLLACEAQLDAAGQVELIAAAKDADGRLVEAATSVWITRQGELWFAQDNDDRIDLLPEKRSYEPGETARLQLRMPYREATALVAIEREGIIDSRVVTVRGDDPTIELKIERDWSPNVYVSVLALRGRVHHVPWYSFFTWGWRAPRDWWRDWRAGRDYQAPTAMVDLAKPSFKLGVAALQVGLARHRLQVTVTPDKPQYGVRQKALARIKVQGADGQPAAGAELAFAAVDEGLLALRPNQSWDLLDAMLRARAWGVETASAQSEIIGRRHYGRKAVAAGGGGGRGATRELFDTLLLWQPRVKLDAKGEALVEVPLNDSLTGFRLVAVADAGAQAFGSAQTTIRVTQDLQLLSGLPPLVREGDQFQALLTLRNTTGREMKLRAGLSGSANIGSEAGPELRREPLNLPAQDLTLAAGAARELQWTVTVPPGAVSLAWEAEVAEQGGGGARDRMKTTQLVQPAVPVRVLQASLTQLDGRLSLPIAAPADALPGRGGINVALQPSLSGALPGLRRFFETYPYSCLEQLSSKALGLGDAKQWQALMGRLPTYLDSDGLANYFPPRGDQAPQGSDRLTAYLLAASHEAGQALPDGARDAMLDGLSAFVEGRVQRRFWSPKPDAEVRRIAALEALSRYGRASARLLATVEARNIGTWPTAALIDWLQIHRRVAGAPERDKRIAEAESQLRSRLNYAGTTLKFSNEEGDAWWWLMDSADANAARLILAVLESPGWKDELPRLVTGALGRQKQGSWGTTTANLWGVLALQKFAARYESVKPAGRSVASLGDKSQSFDWAREPKGGALLLPWPAQAGSLAVEQQGAGKPWVTVQSLAALPLKAPLVSGYRVSKSLQPIEQKVKERWSRGDVVRVRLELEAQADMSWVVLSDPVPGGATILGSGLGGDSAIATQAEQREGSAWLAYEERAFEAWRGYYQYLPRGKHVIEYTLRLNNPGRFQLPPTRAEAMYAPDSFGELPNSALEVQP